PAGRAAGGGADGRAVGRGRLPYPPESAFEWLPPLDLPGPGRQRRWTVLLRLPLLLPHAVVLFFLSLAAFFTAIAGWFAALVLGRLPEPVFRYLAAYLAYEARVGASAMLLVDRYPPFALFRATGYEVRFENRPTHLNRLAVLFRIVLIIPAWIIASLVMSGWWTLGLLWWLITLVLGRMPLALHGASAAALRYHLRTSAYWLLLTPAYPKRFFGDEPGVDGPRGAVLGDASAAALHGREVAARALPGGGGRGRRQGQYVHLAARGDGHRAAGEHGRALRRPGDRATRFRARLRMVEGDVPPGTPLPASPAPPETEPRRAGPRRHTLMAPHAAAQPAGRPARPCPRPRGAGRARPGHRRTADRRAGRQRRRAHRGIPPGRAVRGAAGEPLPGGGAGQRPGSPGRPGLPVPLEARDPLAEGGRGLLLIRALAAACGHRPTDWGKAVWFRLAAPTKIPPQRDAPSTPPAHEPAPPTQPRQHANPAHTPPQTQPRHARER
ncbi:protein of unknown function, partial [Streptomyces sp. SolWspMP-sol7th]